MKIEQRPWKPQDLLDDLQSIIDEEPDSYLNTRRVTLCMARDYLKEYFSSLPNDPLTLKELWDMDGEPVWWWSLMIIPHTGHYFTGIEKGILSTLPPKAVPAFALKLFYLSERRFTAASREMEHETNLWTRSGSR